LIVLAVWLAFEQGVKVGYTLGVQRMMANSQPGQQI
jgi:hypothetical protein